MAYQPTAEDFDLPMQSGGYQPTSEDFEDDDESNPMELELNKGRESTGWKALGADMVRSLTHALKGGVGLARRAPGEAADIASDLIHHPLSTPPHIGQQLLASLGEGGKELLNLPHNVIGELGRKELIPDFLKKYNELPFTHIPEDTGVEKFLGLEPTKKSDELIRAFPAIYGGGKLLTSAVKKVGKAVSAPSKEALFQRALEDEVKKATKEHKLSKGDLSSLQDSLKLKYSQLHGEELPDVTPVGQQVGINTKQHKLDIQRPLTEIPEREVREVPSEPDTKAIVDAKREALDKARSEAESALGTLDNPRLKGGAKVKKAIQEVKQSASDLYNSARNHYVDQNIVADNSAEIKSVTEDLNVLKDADELAPGYGSGTAEQKALESQLEALKSEKVNASDIFDLQRTLEKMAENTRKKQYSGVTDLEFKRLGGIADRLDSHADKLAKRLEAVGGKDVQKMIKEANAGWRTFKNLANRNPVGKAALKGEIPMRSMIEIAKDHPGNDFLQNLVESDPELKKHMLAAYTGESNVNKLLKPTTLSKKYLESLPEVEEHVNSLKEALAGVKEGEVEASRVKKEYDELVRSMNDAAKEQKKRQDAIKKSDELKRQIKFHEDAIPKLEKKIEAEKKAGHKVERLKEELEKHNKAKQDKGTQLKKLANFILKVKGIQGFGNKLGV